MILEQLNRGIIIQIYKRKKKGQLYQMFVSIWVRKTAYEGYALITIISRWWCIRHLGFTLKIHHQLVQFLVAYPLLDDPHILLIAVEKYKA